MLSTRSNKRLKGTHISCDYYKKLLHEIEIKANYPETILW